VGKLSNCRNRKREELLRVGIIEVGEIIKAEKRRDVNTF